MKVQTLSIIVGTKACNAACPYCVSQMTPGFDVDKAREVNWRNFDLANRFARDNGVSTVLLGVTPVQLGELVASLTDAPRVLVETRRLADPQIVAALAQRYGGDRLVFGTASPLQYASSALLPLAQAAMPEHELAHVMGGNVERLLAGLGG